MARNQITRYAFNIVSIIGMVIAVVSAGLIIALLATEAITGYENPYLGILTYFVLPGGLIFGLLLVPLGMYWVRTKYRVNAPGEVPPYPRLDLNDPHKRKLLYFFIVASIVFVLIVTVATIKGFEFTESPVFCGELCHVPMEPEHTAWQNSPHARVKCVECHVGPGAQWYVKAKISGMRQLWAVATHSFPTPIETPVENLRPAPDTCGNCHWPDKFYFGRQKVFYHYAPNETNTPREINMLLKVGVTPQASVDKGIHGHINMEITYAPRDKKRQDIPYVLVKKDGKTTEYMSVDKPMSKGELASAKKRIMDCIDCHNRPTHIYRSPSREMDENFASGQIDRSLPYVKKVAVEILNKPYKSSEEAKKAIAAELPAYYQKNYPKVATEKAAEIKQAVERVQDIYERNFFPKMKVDYRTYPNNAGHLYSIGCFRCHDGKHKSADGRVISHDCNLCHVVLSQKQENITPGTEVKSFVHPVDLGNAILQTNCSDCHGIQVKEEAEEKHK